jgi:RimJ/RimL family protein N-acetyltransferase
MTPITLSTPRLLLRSWRDADDDAFVDYVGLSIPRFEAHFTPAVEVGCRLASAHWGKGYATEGAKAVLDAGFARLGLHEIVFHGICELLCRIGRARWQEMSERH